MCIEIGLESTRNPRIGEIFQRVDRSSLESFETLFQRLQDEGRIAPALDIPTLAKVFMVVIGDGMFWRRAVDPAFDPRGHAGRAADSSAALLKPGARRPAGFRRQATRRRSEDRS